MGCSERQKELKRRRQRRLKIAKWSKKAEKASGSEKAVLAAKIRNATPGAEVIISRLELEDH